MSKSSWLCAVPILASSLGCQSFSTWKTAHALEAGEYEVGGAVSFVRPSRTTAPGLCDENSGGCADESPLGLSPEIDGRYGIGHGVDLGLRLELDDTELNATINLLKLGPVELAFAPAVGFSALEVLVNTLPGDEERTYYTYAVGEVLLGIKLRPVELVLSPRIQAIYNYNSTDSTGSWWAYRFGMGVGISIQVTPEVRVMPEVTYMAPAPDPPMTFKDFYSDLSDGTGPVWNFAIGVALGGARK